MENPANNNNNISEQSKVLIIFIMKQDSHSDSDIRNIYKMKSIAVVGMSKNEEKAGHFVPKYLMDHGYNIIPVNPTITELLGKKSYPTISDVPEQIDIVDIFRRSEDVPAAIDDAVNKKDEVKVIWMQSGIYNEDAE